MSKHIVIVNILAEKECFYVPNAEGGWESYMHVQICHSEDEAEFVMKERILHFFGRPGEEEEDLKMTVLQLTEKYGKDEHGNSNYNCMVVTMNEDATNLIKTCQFNFKPKCPPMLEV